MSVRGGGVPGGGANEPSIMSDSQLAAIARLEDRLGALKVRL